MCRRLFFFCVRLSHAMCSSHFLSHNQCLLARALASEYFDRQRFASDKRELHLREVLHTLLCPLAQIQSFGCLILWRFFRQPTTMISASVSTLRVEEVPIDMVILPLVSKYRYFSPSRLWFSSREESRLYNQPPSTGYCSFSTLSVTDATATPTRFTRTIP